MAGISEPFIVGRKEWVSLPDLGLYAVKAKIDTGARTSALHADEIALHGAASSPEVRFLVHPIPIRPALSVLCTAIVVDRRDVTSSNGDKELRYIIRTTIRLDGRSWPIEIGLTNREDMTYRMLLGRQAIMPDMLVDPTSAYRQPRLGPRDYRVAKKRRRIK